MVERLGAAFAFDQIAAGVGAGGAEDGGAHRTEHLHRGRAYATAGAFHVVWSDNRSDLSGGAPRKDPNVYYKKISLGLTVSSTTPPAA